MNTNYNCSWLGNLSRYFSPCWGNLAYFFPKKFKLLNILFSISFTMCVSDEGYGIPETFHFLFLSLWAYLRKVTVYQKNSIFYFFHYERIWWRLRYTRNILFSISFTNSVSEEGYGIPETFYFLFLSLWAYLMKVTVYQKHSIFYFFHYERIWWRLRYTRNILFSISFTMSVSDEGYGIPETFYFLFLSLWAYRMKVITRKGSWLLISRLVLFL